MPVVRRQLQTRETLDEDQSVVEAFSTAGSNADRIRESVHTVADFAQAKEHPINTEEKIEIVESDIRLVDEKVERIQLEIAAVFQKLEHAVINYLDNLVALYTERMKFLEDSKKSLEAEKHSLRLLLNNLICSELGVRAKRTFKTVEDLLRWIDMHDKGILRSDPFRGDKVKKRGHSSLA